jgi:hypothetical protein
MEVKLDENYPETPPNIIIFQNGEKHDSLTSSIMKFVLKIF